MAISSRGSGKRVMAEINITPFTDVCLVLLIIFMVSASFLGSPTGMDVKLPKASHKSTNNLPAKDVTISLVKNGTLYLDTQQTTFGSLAGSLQEYAKKNRIRNVIIKADQNVLYDQVVKVMDVVRQTGMSYMSLAVEQARPPQQPYESQ
ncbi:MAG TPA: biopolymer transporter ExbD [Armatimonadota bacterium]|nr:biopolymer transporter ExbD [Armatimonadota bacterium]